MDMAEEAGVALKMKNFYSPVATLWPGCHAMGTRQMVFLFILHVLILLVVYRMVWYMYHTSQMVQNLPLF